MTDAQIAATIERLGYTGRVKTAVLKQVAAKDPGMLFVLYGKMKRFEREDAERAS